MSINYQEAKKLVEKHLASFEFEEIHKPILLKDKIIEKDYGWFFQFTSKSWLENKLTVPGNWSPILILKEKGILIELGNAYSIEQQIYRFDKRYSNQ